MLEAWMNKSAEVEKGREIINVSFESRDKMQSALLVNAIAQAYLTYQTRIHHSNSAEILDLLEKQKQNAVLQPIFFRPKGTGRPTKKDRRNLGKLDGLF